MLRSLQQERTLGLGINASVGSEWKSNSCVPSIVTQERRGHKESTESLHTHTCTQTVVSHMQSHKLMHSHTNVLA